MSLPPIDAKFDTINDGAVRETGAALKPKHAATVIIVRTSRGHRLRQIPMSAARRSCLLS